MSALQARRQRLQQAADGLWPYRRDLSDIEAASRVDVPSLDHEQQATEEELTAAWAPLRRRVVEEIVSAVEDATTRHAPGDTSWVASIAIDVPDATPLAAAMLGGIDAGRALALDEAHAQSPALAERVAGFPRPNHTERIRSYSEGAVAILVGGLVQSASREAFRLTLATDVDVPAAVLVILGDLPMLYERDVLGGMACGAVNEGRYEVMQAVLGGASPLVEAAEGVASIYALEILDGNTCDECAAIDGQEYFSIDAARLDYPGIGGGYVDCAGRDRCRGTLVIVYGDEATARPESIKPPKPPPKPKPPKPPPKPSPLSQALDKAEAEQAEAKALADEMASAKSIAEILHPIGSTRLWEGTEFTVAGYTDDGSVLIKLKGMEHVIPVGIPVPADKLAVPHAPIPPPPAPLPPPPLRAGDFSGFPDLPDPARLTTHEVEMQGTRAVKTADAFNAAMAAVPDMSRGGRNALHEYSGSGYRGLNSMLRGNDIEAQGYSRTAAEILRDDLDDAFKTDALTLPEDVLSWRGASIDEGADIVEEIITEGAFVSTSGDERTALAGFGSAMSSRGREKVLLRMHIRAGEKYLPGLLGETELLLNRGTRYLVFAERERVTVPGTTRTIRQFDVVVLKEGEHA